jgi:hypothetical protein
MDGNTRELILFSVIALVIVAIAALVIWLTPKWLWLSAPPLM